MAIAQVDSVLGDVDANVDRAQLAVERAVADGADLVVFPELALHGYALAQLAVDRSIRRDDPRLQALPRPGVDVVVGFHEDGGLRRYNSVGYFAADAPPSIHRKLYLPNYLSWEERKTTSPGQELSAFETRHGRMAALICADAWQLVLPWLAVQDGAEILVIPANSAQGPDWSLCAADSHWTGLLPTLARMLQCWVVFANRVGTEAGHQFWGGSQVVDPSGTVVAEAARWQPDLILADVDVSLVRRRRREVPLLHEARFGLVAREVARLIAAGGDA